MILCVRCGEKKSVSSFYKRANSRNGLRSECKKCNNAINKKSYQKNIERNRERKRLYQKERYANGISTKYRTERKRLKFLRLQEEYGIELKCKICGYDEHIEALDFHHRERSQKESCVKTLINSSWKAFITEALKCDILCANCHRLLHTKHGLMGENPYLLPLKKSESSWQKQR